MNYTTTTCLRVVGPVEAGIAVVQLRSVSEANYTETTLNCVPQVEWMEPVHVREVEPKVQILPRDRLS